MSNKVVANSWNGSDNYDHITLQLDGEVSTIVTYRHASDAGKFVSQIQKLITRNAELEAQLKSK